MPNSLVDHRAIKTLVSTLARILRLFSLKANPACHLHFLCLFVLRQFIRQYNDVRLHACNVGFLDHCSDVLGATAVLTTMQGVVMETLRILRMRLLLPETFSHKSMTLDRVAEAQSIHSFLKIPPRTALPGGSPISRVSPTPKYVTLPANASYVTLRNWKARLRLAFELLHDGSRVNMSEAAKIFRAILTLAPHGCNVPLLYANLGAIHLAENELSDAVKCFQKTLAHTPDSWKTHFNLGIAYIRLGRLLKGKEHLKQCVAMQPGYVLARQALAEVESTWISESRDVITATNERQDFANELSNIIVVIKQAPTTKLLEATEHAAETFAISASQQCAVPITQPLTQAWYGVIAELLHRLFVFAALKQIDLSKVFESHCKSSNSESISIEDLEAIVDSVTQTKMTLAEKEKVREMFPSGEILYPILQPNPETVSTIFKIKETGPWYNALIHRRVGPHCRRHHHHYNPSTLWDWLDMPLFAWIKSINQGRCQVAKFSSVILKAELYTVIHLARAQPKLQPQDFKGLNLNERGTLIFELYGLRTSVERAAGCLVQGVGRVVLARAQLRRLRELRDISVEDRNIDGDQRLSLAESLAQRQRDDAIMAIVDLVLVQVVDQVQYRLYMAPPSKGMPVRTELRQKVHFAATSIQQKLRENRKSPC
ncbi:hypothetical protein Ae201684_012984 [Aphanomyces euteiches]|uniref:Uncharacterized protein n=1 Tax=Aphanomyces euteiches TaxID=100861 RepID=A0A6G0WQ34_9STRA|nr:hypothetical protein Ae201684_012984 [Aphanomyces euteiches]